MSNRQPVSEQSILRLVFDQTRGEATAPGGGRLQCDDLHRPHHPADSDQVRTVVMYHVLTLYAGATSPPPTQRARA